ncbi:MAG: hypothetical protein QOJ19_3107 [Acidimicrobiia bacterium]|nr:hypothetical protein [Acidimicrobiia bacterium]
MNRRASVTQTGWWGIGVAATLLVIAWVFGYRGLFVVASVLALSIVAAAGWLVSRPRVGVERTVDPVRVEAGDVATARLVLVNLLQRRTPALVARENFGGRDIEVSLPSLAAGQRAVVSYALPTTRRGILGVGPLRVGSTDPFGFFRARQAEGADAALIVHPRWRPVGPFRSGRSAELDGTTTRETLRGGVAFHSLRPYVAGDDMRLIHWRTSAKTGSLMVRHNVDATLPRGAVLLDVNPTDFATEEAFELAVSVAASLVMSAGSHFVTMELRTTSGLRLGVPAGSSTTAAMDVLAQVSPVEGLAASEAVVLLRTLRQACALVIISGRLEVPELAHLSSVVDGFDHPTLVLTDDGSPPAGQSRLTTLRVSSLDDFARSWDRRVRG